MIVVVINRTKTITTDSIGCSNDTRSIPSSYIFKLFAIGRQLGGGLTNVSKYIRCVSGEST